MHRVIYRSVARKWWMGSQDDAFFGSLSEQSSGLPIRPGSLIGSAVRLKRANVAGHGDVIDHR